MTYQLTEKNISDIALGTGFLGSGGGGDTKMAEIMTKKAILDGAKITCIPFDNIKDETLTVAVAIMGAPTVLAEKLPSKEEGIIAIRRLEQALQKTIDHIIPAEIGGLNGLYGIYLAAQTQKSIVDGDCMGRAFPEIHMIMPYVYGTINPCIAALANAQDSCILTANNLPDLELQARQQTIKMGGIVTIAYLPLSGQAVREHCVPGSISIAKNIGQYLHKHKEQELMQFLNKALTETDYGPAEHIIGGKITELNRNFEQGFNKGWAVIQEMTGHKKIRIDFQNENLRIIDLNTKKIIAQVPHIIALLDNEYRPLSCECLRTGLEVSVIILEVPPLLRTEKALAVFGPTAFALDF